MATNDSAVSILIDLVRSNDLESSDISKREIPAEVRAVLDQWIASFNENTEEDTVTFENSINDRVIHSKWFDDEKEIFTFQYGYFFQDKILGWLILDRSGIVGDLASSL